MKRIWSRSTVRLPDIRRVLLVGAAWLPIAAIPADATQEEDLKAQIVHRCHYHMGEFGVEGVHICVEGELSAMQALSAYPQEAAEIVRRCASQVEITGWGYAKSCADKEIAAARETEKGTAAPGKREFSQPDSLPGRDRLRILDQL